MTKIGSQLLNTPANCCIYILKCCVCKYELPCALKINSNGGLKQRHVDPCPSPTKKNISPLSKFLWPPKLGWVVTCKEKTLPKKSHDPLMTWSCEIM